MKKLILPALAVFLCSQLSLASDLTGKSLKVGPADRPNPFSVCIAKLAITQQLNDAYSLARLISSSVGSDAKTATLVFVGEGKVLPKRDFFQLTLSSLDSPGWELVQQSDGEIAPFSQSILEHALLADVRGKALGPVDLSACANQ